MLNIISLGAGVQSSTMALMAAHGEITPMPDCAIFADTQAEPRSVYVWLDWLEKQLPFPVHRVTKGDMTKAALTAVSRKDPSGRQWSKSLIPAYVKNADGTRGIMRRACTYDYKVEQIEKTARRLANIKRGQATVSVIQWIGISWDEAHRMKPARKPWTQHRWPLVDLGMTRQHCLQWMERKNYPTPPRSACVYCPYHRDAEWKRLRDEEPAEFWRAVKFERDLQAIKLITDKLNGVPYLHDSLVPLDQVDLRTAEDAGQMSMFGNECEGMCGT